MNGKAKTTVLSEFVREMDQNPLGNSPERKVVPVDETPYVAEYYSSGIAGRVVEIFRRATPDEDHFREWKRVGHHTEGLHTDNARDLYDSLDPETLPEHLNESD